MNNCRLLIMKMNSKETLMFGAGKSMPSSDRDPEGCGLVGHGVPAAFHVSRGGARGSGAATGLPEDGPDAPGPGFGGR